MIESLEGEEHIDEILSTPGLAMVWLAHMSTEAVANEIVKKCVERGIFVASPHVDPTSFKADMDAGYRMFFFGWDRDMFDRDRSVGESYVEVRWRRRSTERDKHVARVREAVAENDEFVEGRLAVCLASSAKHQRRYGQTCK